MALGAELMSSGKLRRLGLRQYHDPPPEAASALELPRKASARDAPCRVGLADLYDLNRARGREPPRVP